MKDPNIAQFARSIGKDPSYLSRICKKLGVTGSADPRNPKSRLLSIDDREKLMDYFGMSPQSNPELVPNQGSVDIQFVEAEIVEAGENVALSFPVADRSAETAAVRADGLAIAATTQTNFAAFRLAQRRKAEEAGKRMAVEDFQAMQASYQAEMNGMMNESFDAAPETPAQVSSPTKKTVGGDSAPP
jgi:hypothetical protein